MKKLLTLTVLFAFLFGGMVYATDTRVLTMGDANGIVKDEANVFIYPSTINYYPKLFVGEYGSGTEFSRVGAHFEFMEETSPMVFGAYFRTDEWYWPEILVGYEGYPKYAYFWEDYLKATADMPEDALYNRRITLMYGTKLGEIPFGMTINFDNAKQKEEADEWNPERSFTRLGIKLGISPMEGKLDLAGGISFMTWTDKDPNGEDVTKPSGNMRVDFNGRYWMDPMGKWTLVPHFGFSYEKQGVEIPDVRKITGTAYAIDLGLGTNYDASENVMGVTDFGVSLISGKYKDDPEVGDIDEYKYSYLYLPYFRIGVDAKIFSWMDFRGGVKCLWVTEKEDEVEGDWKGSWGYVYTDTYLGAGFNWNKLEIDAQVDPNFLNRAPYFISGSGGDLNTQVSLIYWFD